MPTIAENLQTLINLKAKIKTALKNQGKEPTEALGTYAGLIDDLENPDMVTYFVTLDGVNQARTQLHGQEKVQLTAGPNDIRKNTVAITEKGVTTGEKNIPAYFSRYGYSIIAAGSEAIIDKQEDYKDILVTIAPFDTSVSNSVSINHVSVENSMYKVNSTTKLSDIVADTMNQQVKLGVTVDVMSILRYFVVREEG